MKKYILGLVLALLLPINSAHSADKPCSKSQVNKIKGNTVCTQITKYRYAWLQIKQGATTNKQTVTVPVPTPTTTALPKVEDEAYSFPSEKSDAIENCKIKEDSTRRGFTVAGFPDISPLTTRTGTVKWALIPIDFQDLKGEPDFKNRVNNDMKLLSEWFETVSEGRFKVEWVIADNWVRLPGNSSDYNVNKVTGLNNTSGGIKLFQTAIKSADPTFDFTNIQTVNFILPMNQNIANEGENGFPWDQHVKEMITNEGKISSFSITGKYQTKDNKTLWNYWAHEFGHAIGLPHVGGNSGYSPFWNWDVLGDQDGVSRELSGWVRFLAGWMPEDKIFCKNSSSVSKLEINLVPISNKENGIKLVILPLSANKAIVIESRRVTKFSCTTPTPRDGVLAYYLDLTLGHAQDFMTPISVSSRNSEEAATCNGVIYGKHLNQLLLEGDTVSFQGLKISVLKQGKFDKIVVSK